MFMHLALRRGWRMYYLHPQCTVKTVVQLPYNSKNMLYNMIEERTSCLAFDQKIAHITFEVIYNFVQ